MACLLEAGVDVERRDTWGHSPLCISAMKGGVDIMLRLLAAGADMNRQDGSGLRPIDYAIHSGMLAQTESLAAAGASVHGCLRRVTSTRIAKVSAACLRLRHFDTSITMLCHKQVLLRCGAPVMEDDILAAIKNCRANILRLLLPLFDLGYTHQVRSAKP